jgi:hypothetical protein
LRGVEHQEERVERPDDCDLGSIGSAGSRVKGAQIQSFYRKCLGDFDSLRGRARARGLQGVQNSSSPPHVEPWSRP